MANGGNWTQLLTLGAVILGGMITMATTWLANLQQNAERSRERREGSLMPLYLSLQVAIRDWVVLLEAHALAGFPQEGFSDREARIRDAWEVLHRITYQIDLMSPPWIAFDTELVEDSLIRLTENLGFRIRLTSIPPIPEAQCTDYVRSELREISDRRIRLVERMQEDLALYGGSSRLGRTLRTIMPKSILTNKYRALKHGPAKRDDNKFRPAVLFRQAPPPRDEPSGHLRPRQRDRVGVRAAARRGARPDRGPDLGHHPRAGGRWAGGAGRQRATTAPAIPS
jgi:hypothetical protein